MQNSKRIIYNDPGTLEGHINNQLVKVRHSETGQSGFQVFWDGQWYSYLFAGLVEEELGIEVHHKKKGTQKGYPSEAVGRSIWRYLVDHYNDCDPGVKYLG
ncbi:MAG: hypothetical protein HY528_03945 [Chloroflexi bacterium]|nr:hypothetical protein [Chloroflexota bacterium]